MPKSATSWPVSASVWTGGVTVARPSWASRTACVTRSVTVGFESTVPSGVRGSAASRVEPLDAVGELGGEVQRERRSAPGSIANVHD